MIDGIENLSETWMNDWHFDRPWTQLTLIIVKIMRDERKRRPSKFAGRTHLYQKDNTLEGDFYDLVKKDLDFIVANVIGGAQGGFCRDDNQVVLLGQDGFRKPYALASKKEIAEALLEMLEPAVYEKRASLNA